MQEKWRMFMERPVHSWPKWLCLCTSEPHMPRSPVGRAGQETSDEPSLLNLPRANKMLRGSCAPTVLPWSSCREQWSHNNTDRQQPHATGKRPPKEICRVALPKFRLLGKPQEVPPVLSRAWYLKVLSGCYRFMIASKFIYILKFLCNWVQLSFQGCWANFLVGSVSI
jgi:hypothetical protein